MFTATRRLQIEVLSGVLRSSGSRVRLPVTTTTFMFEAANALTPLKLLAEFQSKSANGAISPPRRGLSPQRAGRDRYSSESPGEASRSSRAPVAAGARRRGGALAARGQST